MSHHSDAWSQRVRLAAAKISRPAEFETQPPPPAPVSVQHEFLKRKLKFRRLRPPKSDLKSSLSVIGQFNAYTAHKIGEIPAEYAGLSTEGTEGALSARSPRPSANGEWALLTKLEHQEYEDQLVRKAKEHRQQQEGLRQYYVKEISVRKQQQEVERQLLLTEAERLQQEADLKHRQYEEKQHAKQRQVAAAQAELRLEAERKRAVKLIAEAKKREEEKKEAEALKVALEADHLHLLQRKIALKQQIDSVMKENEVRQAEKQAQAKREAAADIELMRKHAKHEQELEMRRQRQQDAALDRVHAALSRQNGKASSLSNNTSTSSNNAGALARSASAEYRTQLERQAKELASEERHRRNRLRARQQAYREELLLQQREQQARKLEPRDGMSQAERALNAKLLQRLQQRHQPA